MGAALIAALSPFDAGQGVVVAKGRVVAIEAAEGTDAMLARVAELREARRLRLSGPSGVFVKAPKRGQDLRLDMPAIGPQTIAAAAKAQLQGVAVAAGAVLIAERDAVARAADVVRTVRRRLRAMSAPTRRLRIAIVAGEPSGDQLGFKLMRALGELTGGGVDFLGVGGEAMAAEGLKSLFPLADVAVMGVLPVIERLPTLIDRIRRAAAAIVAARPDALVIIDSPDFTHRVARRVRRALPDLPVIDYVSPSVWAWRPGRAPSDARLCRLRARVAAVRAGSARATRRPALRLRRPSAGRAARRTAAERATRRCRRAATPPLVLALPGSRRSVIATTDGRFRRGDRRRGTRGGPVRSRSADPAACRERCAHARGALVAPAAYRRRREREVRGLPQRARGARRVGHRHARTRACRRAARRRLQGFAGSRRLLRPLVTLPFSVLLPNLVLGEAAIPEFLQGDCQPQALATALAALVSDGPARSAQLAALDKLDARMRLADGRAPSAHAAAAVLKRSPGANFEPERVELDVRDPRDRNRGSPSAG